MGRHLKWCYYTGETERGEWTEIKFDKVLEPMVLFTY
jgi:hypothetical protein